MLREMYLAACRLRSHNPKADGWLYWQEVKKCIRTYFPEADSMVIGQWMTTKDCIILEKYGPLEATSELHHFACQIGYHILDQPMTLMKALQYMLNAGQYVGTAGGATDETIMNLVEGALEGTTFSLAPFECDEQSCKEIVEWLKNYNI